MSIEATLATWKLDSEIVTATEKLFLLSCADRAGEEGICWPSLSRLSADTCLNIKTVKAVRQSCIKKGLLIYTGEKKGRTKNIHVMKLTYVSHRGDEDLNKPKIGPVKQAQNWASESISNNLKEIKEKNIKKRKEPVGLKLEDVEQQNPFNLSLEVLQDFFIVRKNKKAAVTQTAWKRLLTELEKCSQRGYCVQECFEIMVTHGWLSLKVEWIDNMKKPNKLSGTNPAPQWTIKKAMEA